MNTDRATDVVAVAGAVSPVWLPFLVNVSHVAALLLPIFGVLWLIVQIIMKLTGWPKPDED